MMKSRISILVVMVLILLSGCTMKEVENKIPDNKEPAKKVEDNKILEPEEGNKPLLYEVNKIYNLGQSAEMDIDGDGKKDTITYVRGVSESGNSMDHYVLTINENELKGVGNRMEWDLLALSLDGKELFLIIYDDGPSADPLSSFYQYDDGILEHIGDMDDDIRACQIKDNQIFGMFRCDLIQTQVAYGSWKINAEGKLVAEEYEEYRLVDDDQYKSTLLMDLPVHKEKDLSTEITVIAPQKVAFLKTDLNNWTYVEAVDGTGGWMYNNEDRIIEELGLAPMDVFENLTMYD